VDSRAYRVRDTSSSDRYASQVRKKLAALLAFALTSVVTAGVAHAVYDTTRNGSPGNSPSQLVMAGVGPGHGVVGFLGPDGSVSDPSVPYPTANPGAPFTPKNEDFAGVIFGDPGNGGADVKLYCINIRTDTFGGVGYDLGTYDAANVPNVGYVARLLNNYYPAVPTQPALANDADRAAAVQAAIWYFSDNYVVNTGDPLHDTVAGIVNNVIALGPLVNPPPPSLEIDPTSSSGPVGSLVGPYTVVSPQEPAVVSATDGDMFADAAGTVPIADGATVPDGTQIWLQRTTLGSATLSATATAIVPGGNVYLYAHNIPGVDDAQKLILADSGEVSTTVAATADFFDTASLEVTKTIAGEAAGLQSDVHISVVCDGTALPDFVIPAGSTGSTSTTYHDIPAPATCDITETVNGVNTAVTVSTTNASQSIDLPQTDVPDDLVTAAPITNTYVATNVGPDVIVVPIPVLLSPRFSG
jgi:TQXA domain-containing protein